MTVELGDMLDGRVLRNDGRSLVLASRMDARCSYCFYVPPQLRHASAPSRLLVYVHGEGRRFQFVLNALRSLADHANLIVVCPLFPANIFRDGNIEGFKYLRERDIHYDEVLIDIVAEVQSAFPLSHGRILLGGFSGGAQFAHRFFYLHPQMLEAVSIAAPGSVSLLDETLPWWPGVGEIESAFGRSVEIESLQQVPLQLIIGDADHGTVSSVSSSASELSPHDIAGRTRVERVYSLHESWMVHELNVEMELLSGVGHNFLRLLPSIEAFLLKHASTATLEITPEQNAAAGAQEP